MWGRIGTLTAVFSEDLYALLIAWRAVSVRLSTPSKDKTAPRSRQPRMRLHTFFSSMLSISSVASFIISSIMSEMTGAQTAARSA
jgi:hypothetical protein